MAPLSKAYPHPPPVVKAEAHRERSAVGGG
jgi:hypothetical protein